MVDAILRSQNRNTRQNRGLGIEERENLGKIQVRVCSKNSIHRSPNCPILGLLPIPSKLSVKFGLVSIRDLLLEFVLEPYLIGLQPSILRLQLSNARPQLVFITLGTAKKVLLRADQLSLLGELPLQSSNVLLLFGKPVGILLYFGGR